jgi:nickel-dependent lactate racemase
MDIHIPYSEDHIPVQIPDEKVLGIFQPNPVQIGNEHDVVLQALEQPLDSPSFPDFLKDARDVLIIVNDATRPTPTSKVLEIIASQIDETDVSFIIATGNHRGPTEDEFRFIFGPFYDKYKSRIHVHDAGKDDDMVYLGVSTSGTEMYVNRLGRQKILPARNRILPNDRTKS